MENTSTPLITIVILNYNGLEYLKETIPPLLRLEYPNYEIIIVDNKSTDNSLSFLRSFKYIKIIESNENVGYSRGKNIGVRNANGEYVLMIDNDILIRDKTILAQLINLYRIDEKIGFTQILLSDLGNDVTEHYGLFYSIYGVNLHQKKIDVSNIINYSDTLILIGSPTGGCMFFKKTFWDKIGGFDESQEFNIDDVDIGPRAYLLGYHNVLYTKSFFIHLGVNNALSNNIYASRFSLIFSGHARSMIKNYKISNLLLRFPLFYMFHMIKAIRYSLKRKSLRVLYAFCYSNIVFLKSIPDTLKQRKIIQSSRIINNDIYLAVKPPRFQ